MPFVCVVGGGNSTPIFAALAKAAGYEVGILTRKPQDWDKDDVGFDNEDTGYMDGKTSLRVAVVAFVWIVAVACVTYPWVLWSLM